MLTEEIEKKWTDTPKGHAAVIDSLRDAGYPAWTIRPGNSYGVAMEIPEHVEIDELFSGARLYDDMIDVEGTGQIHALILLTEKTTIKRPFASLCAELILPGQDGSLREEIINNPLLWWTQWKELLGNKNVDERVYDVLGELSVLRYLIANESNKGKTIEWNGPDSATYDIDAETCYYEVKSTTAREKRQITLSNHFQLDPPEGKQLKLVLCQFERSTEGICINGLVDELVDLGYSRMYLDDKLERLGLGARKSARIRCYDLHAMIEYVVDEDFPAIRETSFKGDTLPVGVETITYTISLDGIQGTNITKH